MAYDGHLHRPARRTRCPAVSVTAFAAFLAGAACRATDGGTRLEKNDKVDGDTDDGDDDKGRVHICGDGTGRI